MVGLLTQEVKGMKMELPSQQELKRVKQLLGWEDDPNEWSDRDIWIAREFLDE